MTLKGWFIPSRTGSDRTLIMCHGWGDNKGYLLERSYFLNKTAGFNLLYFDNRSHGESAGRVTTIGCLETIDFEAAIGFLKQNRPSALERLGVFGMSMGAAVAILSMPKHPEIKAAVLESPFPDYRNVVRRWAWNNLRMPYFPMVLLTLLMLRWRVGIPEVDGYSPIAFIPRIAPRPVFIIGGALDSSCPGAGGPCRPRAKTSDRAGGRARRVPRQGPVGIRGEGGNLLPDPLMRIVEDPGSMSGLCARWRERGERVGLVPTMGALHAGHASLIRRSRAENDRTVVSVFVNPTQFGPKEDFSAYPRPFPADILLCRREGADAVFHPSPPLCTRPGPPPSWRWRGSRTRSVETVDRLSARRDHRGPQAPQHRRIPIGPTSREGFPAARDHQAYGQGPRPAVRITGCPTLREPTGSPCQPQRLPAPRERAHRPRPSTRPWREGQSWHAVPDATEPPGPDTRTPPGNPGASVDYVALVDRKQLQPARALRPGLRLLTAVRSAAPEIDNVITS